MKNERREMFDYPLDTTPTSNRLFHFITTLVKNESDVFHYYLDYCRDKGNTGYSSTDAEELGAEQDAIDILLCFITVNSIDFCGDKPYLTTKTIWRDAPQADLKIFPENLWSEKKAIHFI